MSIRRKLSKLYYQLLCKKNLINQKILSGKKKDGFSGKTIPLNEPSKTCGLDLMEAFRKRRSTRTFELQEPSLQELSDLLWAANGINRQASGEKTAPSAMNSQDVDIYVCRKDGTYLYDAGVHCLRQITEQDIRPLTEGLRPTGAPVILLLVTDISRYKDYNPENVRATKRMNDMGTLDAGIVSQNIGLFCAGAGLGTVPRIGMDNKSIRLALDLKETQIPWLNNPIGYPKYD